MSNQTVNVIPIRPLERQSKEPMRTWLHQEIEPETFINISVRGATMMHEVRDLERLLEYIRMVKRWAEEDDKFRRERNRQLADKWWEHEMAILAPSRDTPSSAEGREDG